MHSQHISATAAVLIIAAPFAYSQERLNVNFPNGDFERTTRITGVDGTTRPAASTTVFNGFTHGGGFGDDLAVFKIDETESRPGSQGDSSLHIMHPPNRFATVYQSHFGQTARGNQDLFGLTFNIEVWVRAENWWGSTNHYVQVWIMPVARDGVTLGDTNALDPLAIFLGPFPDDPSDQIKNRIAATTEWTLYRLENVEITEPGTFGFYLQISAWFNNTDNGNRVPGDSGEVTGDAHVWVDDIRLVIPSGSDVTAVDRWMLFEN